MATIRQFKIAQYTWKTVSYLKSYRWSTKKDKLRKSGKILKNTYAQNRLQAPDCKVSIFAIEENPGTDAAKDKDDVKGDCPVSQDWGDERKGENSEGYPEEDERGNHGWTKHEKINFTSQLTLFFPRLPQRQIRFSLLVFPKNKLFGHHPWRPQKGHEESYHCKVRSY